LPSVTFYGLKIYLNALAAGSGELTGLPIPLAGFKGPLHGGRKWPGKEGRKKGRG